MAADEDGEGGKAAHYNCCCFSLVCVVSCVCFETQRTDRPLDRAPEDEPRGRDLATLGAGVQGNDAYNGEDHGDGADEEDDADGELLCGRDAEFIEDLDGDGHYCFPLALRFFVSLPSCWVWTPDGTKGSSWRGSYS